MKSKLHLLLLTLGLAALSAAAQVPGIISHQGKVMVNGTNYTTSSGLFKFALVDAAGTTTYWSQDGTSSGGAEPASAVTLPVTRGIFSVNLGDTTVANMTQTIPASVFANSAVYLRTWFNDGVDGSQQLSPDVRLVSVGYALTAGSVQIQDGTQGVGRVLTSDANGKGSWSSLAGVTPAVLGVIAGYPTPNIGPTPTYTGTYITLPPGKWSVQIAILLPTDSSSYWCRTGFSASSTTWDGSKIPDVIGSSYYASGSKQANQFGMISGTIILNNTSGANKTYYYWTAGPDVYSGTFSLPNFATTAWDEDQIVAYPMN
jgi:hypothetical protein